MTSIRECDENVNTSEREARQKTFHLNEIDR